MSAKKKNTINDKVGAISLNHRDQKIPSRNKQETFQPINTHYDKEILKLEMLKVTTCVCNKTGSCGLDNPKVVPFVNTRGHPLSLGSVETLRNRWTMKLRKKEKDVENMRDQV